MKILFLFLFPVLFSSANVPQKDTYIDNSKNNLSLSYSNKSSAEKKTKNPLDFIPKGYVLYKEDDDGFIKGDLNKDGLPDLVFIIKGTDKRYFVEDEYRGTLDQNRRGIIVLFNKGDYYELACKNYHCFDSDQEDGGNYYPPELWLSIKKGNLYIHYSHGRYGSWQYTFRHQNNDMALIGYDSYENRGPVPQSETSINFLTKKKLTRDNLNKDVYGDEYIEDNFVDTWEKIKVPYLLKLSKIKNFSEIDF